MTKRAVVVGINDYSAIIPASGSPIADRDLFNIADKLQPSFVQFTVILDSCHSGGMDQETDAVFKCKSPVLSDELLQQMVNFLRTLVPCGILIPLDSDACDGNVTSVSNNGGVAAADEDTDKVFVEQAKTTLIAGCKFNQLSWETDGHGLLTKAFLNTVNASNFQITYSELLDQLRGTVTSDFSPLIAPSITSDLPQSQTPQLRGQKNRMNQGFLQGFIDSR